jgi:hypothetical protein
VIQPIHKVSVDHVNLVVKKHNSGCVIIFSICEDIMIQERLAIGDLLRSPKPLSDSIISTSTMI